MKLYFTKDTPDAFVTYGVDSLTVWFTKPTFIEPYYYQLEFGERDVDKYSTGFWATADNASINAKHFSKAFDANESFIRTHMFDLAKHTYAIDAPPDTFYATLSKTYQDAKFEFYHAHRADMYRVALERDYLAEKQAAAAAEREGMRFYEWIGELDLSVSLSLESCQMNNQQTKMR